MCPCTWSLPNPSHAHTHTHTAAAVLFTKGRKQEDKQEPKHTCACDATHTHASPNRKLGRTNSKAAAAAGCSSRRFDRFFLPFRRVLMLLWTHTHTLKHKQQQHGGEVQQPGEPRRGQTQKKKRKEPQTKKTVKKTRKQCKGEGWSGLWGGGG